MKSRILQFVAIGLAGWLAVTLTTASAAQDISSLGKQMASPDNLSTLAQQLHLTPAQAQKVLPILKAEIPKLQAIQGSSNLSDTQKTSQAQAVQQQSDSKLKPILSAEQFSSLKNFRSAQLQELLHGALPH
jgi:hypothetical protein